MTPEFGITDAWVALVKREECWRPKPYLDPVGLPTIGYGHRIPSLVHPEITEAEGEVMLRDDLKTARDAAVSASPNLLDESANRCAAVADFCYNVGPAKYMTSTFKKRIDDGLWHQAAFENRRWVHGTVNGAVVVLPGLVRRRDTTSDWLEQG